MLPDYLTDVLDVSFDMGDVIQDVEHAVLA
jgi:hypothetical protein